MAHSSNTVQGSTLTAANMKALIQRAHIEPSAAGVVESLKHVFRFTDLNTTPRAASKGACLRALVKHATQAVVFGDVCTPRDAIELVDWSAVSLDELVKPVSVIMYGIDTVSNHVEYYPVSHDDSTELRPVLDSNGQVVAITCIMPLGKFMLCPLFMDVVFNASEPAQGYEPPEEQFGGGLSHVLPGGGPPSPSPVVYGSPAGQPASGSPGGRGRESFAPGPYGPVADTGFGSGGSNVGGVVRARRTIGAKMTGSRVPARRYEVARGAQFNNMDELFLDRLSPPRAQEVIERFFEECGLPFSQPEAMRYAEDLTKAFLVARTASDKADYNAVFDVPVKPMAVGGERVTTVALDFSVLSRLIPDEFTATRRQFARGYADVIRAYLMDPENSEVLPLLADRAGCDLQMATLAFDGSTGCSGKTVAERQFTSLLESRNLFESQEILATDASKKLMLGRY